MNNMEQHLLKDKHISKIKRILNKKYIINYLNKHKIIEIGIGTGQFTKVFINKKRNCKAFEIDKSFKFILNKNFKNYNIKIFFKAFEINNLNYKNKKYLIVSAPPYSLLKDLSFLIKKYKYKYILMVGENYLKYFLNFKKIYILEGLDFIPISKGKHYIITNL